MAYRYNPDNGQLEWIEMAGYIPYTGAVQDVDLGAHSLNVGNNITGGISTSATIEPPTNIIGNAIFNPDSEGYDTGSNVGNTYKIKIQSYKVIDGVRIYSAKSAESDPILITSVVDFNFKNSWTWDASVSSVDGYVVYFYDEFNGYNFDYTIAGGSFFTNALTLLDDQITKALRAELFPQTYYTALHNFYGGTTFNSSINTTVPLNIFKSGALVLYSDTDSSNIGLGSNLPTVGNPNIINNVFLGANVASAVVTSAFTTDNVCIGSNVGKTDPTYTLCTLLGSRVGSLATTLVSSTIVGALSCSSTLTINGMIGLGYSIFNGTGTENIVIGNLAGGSLINGTRNITIGQSAGSTSTITGGYNILVGAGVTYPSTTLSGQMNIGNVLYALNLYQSTTKSSTPTATGKIGVRVATPTAQLHLAAGSATAQTAPLKFTTGALMTTGEAGAVEFLTDKFYGTITTGNARKELALTDIALTSGRVPFATTNGRLTDNAAFTFAGTTLTVTNFGAHIQTGNKTFANGINIIFNTTTGTKIGTATTEKFAFHNAIPVIQRAGAAQVAVATTAATNITPFGFTTAAQADAIITLLNEIRATLVEKGLMKGAV